METGDWGRMLEYVSTDGLIAVSPVGYSRVMFRVMPGDPAMANHGDITPPNAMAGAL